MACPAALGACELAGALTVAAAAEVAAADVDAAGAALLVVTTAEPALVAADVGAADVAAGPCNDVAAVDDVAAAPAPPHAASSEAETPAMPRIPTVRSNARRVGFSIGLLLKLS